MSMNTDEVRISQVAARILSVLWNEIKVNKFSKDIKPDELALATKSLATALALQLAISNNGIMLAQLMFQLIEGIIMDPHTKHIIDTMMKDIE